MSRAQLIELAATLQATRVYLMEHGARYKPAADALIDVLVELHRAAKWREWERRTAQKFQTMPDRSPVRPRACSGCANSVWLLST